MVTIVPVQRALVPVDAEAAARLSAPNYDEFQGDVEVWEALREAPDSVLRITMAHCAVEAPDRILPGDSDEALARAARHMDELRASSLVRTVERVLYVYEILDPRRPDVRQIGLGGMARTSEILTTSTPAGTIVRNEGVREPKARGRARLIEATHAIIGTVNNALADEGGAFAAALERYAEGGDPDYGVTDPRGVQHRIWLVTEPGAIARLQRRLAEEPEAYVADGNHRSAAAAMLGHEHFLAVFFPAGRMGIAPYNRLVRTPDPIDDDDLEARLSPAFEIGPAPGGGPYQPERTHEIGLYETVEGWRRLRPRPGTWDPTDAARSIDHDIVQRQLFDRGLGMDDPGHERLTFVGANRDAAWLQGEVDAGRADMAITLPAVTMEQFIAVCRQRKMMPPKSTWFEPKIRSGLLIAEL